MFLFDLLSLINFGYFSFLMSKIDIKEKRLPNRFMYPAILIAISLLSIESIFNRDLALVSTNLIPTLIFTLIFLVTSFIFPLGFGLGDVKGILLLGLSLSKLGSQALLLSLSMSFVIASFYIIYLRLIKKKAIKDLAFGPFLFAPGVVLMGLNLFL